MYSRRMADEVTISELADHLLSRAEELVEQAKQCREAARELQARAVSDEHGGATIHPLRPGGNDE